MNRAEVIMRYLAHRAAAAAFREALEADARAELEEHQTAPTWRLPFATVPTAVEHDGVEIVDETKLITYLERKHPDEVKTVKAVRNPQWLGLLLNEAAERGAPAGEDPEQRIVDADGEEIPGVKFRPGGRFKSISVVPTDALRRRLAKVAESYINGDGPLQIEGLTVDG